MTQVFVDAPREFLSAEEIVTRAANGTGGLMAWSIDAAYPADDSSKFPRVGRLGAIYTLEDGTWCTIAHTRPKAKELLALLNAGALADKATEWATAYDDAPNGDEEKPFGIGPAGREKLMAYRGRLWDIESPGGTPSKAYLDTSIEEEIEQFSCRDVGSCCYYEKKDGVFDMVIG